MTVEQLNVIVSANKADFDNKLNAINRQLHDMSAAAERASQSSLGSFKSLAAGLKALGIGKIIKDAITSAMDAVESDSLFETSMGAYEKSAGEWSEKLSADLGLNAYDLRKNVGTIYNMTTSMGIAKNSAYELSTGIVELAEDMASFYNLSSDEAFAKLRSGLTGEAEPLKALGILVDENTVKQYAYKTGIAAVGSELTQTQKVMARYQAMLGQTSNAQGDLARTLDSPANQVRRLKNEFNTLMIEAGNAIMPLVTAVVPIISQAVTAVQPVISLLASGFKTIGEMITFVANKLNAATPAQQQALRVAIALGLAIPAVTLATKALSAAKLIYDKIVAVLTARQYGFAAALKSTLGIIGLLIGAFALFGALGNKSAGGVGDNVEALKDEGETANKTAENLDKAAESTDNLTDAAKRSTAGFDELNKLNGGDTLGSNIISDEDVGNVADFADMIGDIQSQVNASDTTLDIGFNIDMEAFTSFWGAVLGKITSGDLEGAWELLWNGIDDLLTNALGENWTAFKTFWSDVGNKINDGDLLGAIEQVCNAADELLTGLFGESWNNFAGYWKKIGALIANGDIEGALTTVGNSVREAVGGLFEWIEKVTGIQLKKLYDDISKWSYDLGMTIEQTIAKLNGNDSETLDKNAEHNNIKNAVIRAANQYMREGYSPEEALAKAKQDHLTTGELVNMWDNYVAQNNFDINENYQILLESGQIGDTGYYSDIFSALSEEERRRVRGYASGGFPEYGSLFYANENGPEFVGTLGGRTAVVNNSQIETALYNAVRSAITDANFGSDNGGDTHHITLEIDGDVLAETVTRFGNIRNKRFNGRNSF